MIICAQRKFVIFAAVLSAVLFCVAPVKAADEVDSPVPPSLSELETLPRLKMVEEGGLPFNIRAEAIREAALSYGARGGLAWRTFHIRKEMNETADYLDKIFDFRQLLIPAPSGLLIEPPVISEAQNALLISAGGREAAVADTMYDIIANAKIVSAPRTWRIYLERDWGKVTPPPDILRPKDAAERQQWIEWVREGWDVGSEQADAIFQDDLNELVADYQGMVRYRMLLTQGMVSPPYALQVDRGVTGGGNIMRVGDRAVRITGMPELITETELWQPANR